MKSVVIIGKGPSVLRCTKKFIDSFDDVAICNHPVYKRYEHLISNHADYDFINVGDPNPYSRERLQSLGIHTIINTGGRTINNPPLTILPGYKINYHPFYRGVCLDYFKNEYDLDPSTGIMAFHYFVNKPEYNKIGLVGFDLFEKGTPIYYFKKNEAAKSLQYLWDRGSYDKNNNITFNSGHSVNKTYNYLMNQIKTHNNKEFIIYSNYNFEENINLTIL